MQCDRLIASSCVGTEVGVEVVETGLLSTTVSIAMCADCRDVAGRNGLINRRAASRRHDEITPADAQGLIEVVEHAIGNLRRAGREQSARYVEDVLTKTLRRRTHPSPHPPAVAPTRAITHPAE